MAEAATATTTAAATTTPAATTTTTPAGAGATLTSVPAGPDWTTSFKNEEVKAYVSQKGFKTTEDLATSFFNLEKMKGVPEDRLLKLPEKLDGPEARAIWERLGAPKEAKDYALPRDENGDTKLVDSIEGIFHKNNLTKTQAVGVVQSYNDMIKAQLAAQNEAKKNAILQADETLKREWGAQYDANINLAKQGARVLGLDAKTIDLIESSQGREALFKNLQKIGVGVGESNFVEGSGGGNTQMTPEQAQTEINKLIQDRKFGKKLTRGDTEAVAKWNQLNQWAAPGERQIK